MMKLNLADIFCWVVRHVSHHWLALGLQPFFYCFFNKNVFCRSWLNISVTWSLHAAHSDSFVFVWKDSCINEMGLMNYLMEDFVFICPSRLQDPKVCSFKCLHLFSELDKMTVFMDFQMKPSQPQWKTKQGFAINVTKQTDGHEKENSVF